MAKFFNAILILIILVAVGRLMMRGQEHRNLAQERVQLVEKLDGFRVRDPTKYLVQFVESDDPMLFKWRIHVPGGFPTQYLTETGSERVNYFHGSGFMPKGKLESVSIRFELVGDVLRFDMQTLQNGQKSRYVGMDLAAFCQKHWSDLGIKVLGRGAPVEIDVDRKVDLLSITVPDQLLAEMEAKFGKGLARQFSKQLFCRFSFGELALIERRRQQSQGGR